jgi:glycosyltransferase involved in cell wall biosynthesis
LRVLFVGFVWPEPKSSAAGQNILSYIDTCLEQQWHVWFCSSAQTTQHSTNLKSRGVKTFECQLNCSSFNQQVTDINPDIVIFDRYLSFEQFAWRVKDACPNAMLVLDAEDLHFLRHGRSLWAKKQTGELQFQTTKAILEPNNQSALINDITLREMSCIYQADLSLLLSFFEYDVLHNNFNVPAHQICHLPFILNQDANPHSNSEDSVLTTFEDKQDFVFIGNFRHAPNYHAAKILRENIWPTIYKKLKPRFPNISCHVYGAYMSPKAKQLENKAINFYMHGYTDNQYASISEARVMLAPINFGAGIKGKLLDAMRCHTPSITTAIGAEGITHSDWAGLICNDSDAFIQGHNILAHDFNPDEMAKRLINILSLRQQALVETRESNFMQRLLGQQQFLTSKYMSQWIEAKNKRQ